MAIADILNDLQISSGAFYHYFDSKPALLLALVERMGDEVEQVVLPIVQDPVLGALEKLQRFFAALDQWKFAHKRLILAYLPVWYGDENAIVRNKLYQAGAVAMVVSFILMSLVFRENAYLSGTVRVQQERGQTVITTGPYHYVRHPLYAGGLFLFLGTPLLLGSWYGFLMILLFLTVLLVRAVLEERTLLQELPGYDAYMTHVKYRLIPYVW